MKVGRHPYPVTLFIVRYSRVQIARKKGQKYALATQTNCSLWGCFPPFEQQFENVVICFHFFSFNRIFSKNLANKISFITDKKAKRSSRSLKEEKERSNFVLEEKLEQVLSKWFQCFVIHCIRKVTAFEIIQMPFNNWQCIYQNCIVVERCWEKMVSTGMAIHKLAEGCKE